MNYIPKWLNMLITGGSRIAKNQTISYYHQLDLYTKLFFIRNLFIRIARINSKSSLMYLHVCMYEDPFNQNKSCKIFFLLISILFMLLGIWNNESYVFNFTSIKCYYLFFVFYAINNKK